MTSIEFKVPGKSEPGYLRRAKRALQFSQSNGITTPENIDELVNFLADYVSKPIEHAEKVEALYDASEEQFMQMLEALSGGGAAVIPPAKDEQS